VTIRTFSSAWEADLAKTHLEASGINAFILDSQTISVNWLFSNAIGGIKLQVAEDQAKEAKEVLSHTHVDVQELNVEEKIECPQCESKKVTLINWERRWSLVSILLLGFPIFYPRNRYQCQNCGNRWKERIKKPIKKD
jgi:DNA-directed RNA polymerase subunit RPC12/RpoP